MKNGNTNNNKIKNECDCVISLELNWYLIAHTCSPSSPNRGAADAPKQRFCFVLKTKASRIYTERRFALSQINIALIEREREGIAVCNAHTRTQNYSDVIHWSQLTDMSLLISFGFSVQFCWSLVFCRISTIVIGFVCANSLLLFCTFCWVISQGLNIKFLLFKFFISSIFFFCTLCILFQ